jgi:hypothetical protein
MRASTLRAGLVGTLAVLGGQLEPEAAGQAVAPATAKADRAKHKRPTIWDLAKDDPVVFMLPGPIQEAYYLRYRPRDGYRALRATWSEAGAASTYTITLYHTGGLMRGGRVGDKTMQELFQYTMTLAADGQLIEEQQHSIDERDVPPPVLEGYKTWNRNAVKGMVVPWGVEKTVNGKRTFSVSIVFNQIEAKSASFLEDGSLIKERSDPTPSPRAE